MISTEHDVNFDQDVDIKITSMDRDEGMELSTSMSFLNGKNAVHIFVYNRHCYKYDPCKSSAGKMLINIIKNNVNHLGKYVYNNVMTYYDKRFNMFERNKDNRLGIRAHGYFVFDF